MNIWDTAVSKVSIGCISINPSVIPPPNKPLSYLPTSLPPAPNDVYLAYAIR